MNPQIWQVKEYLETTADLAKKAFETGPHCMNPHERVYRGCTSSCKRFETCQAVEKKK